MDEEQDLKDILTREDFERLRRDNPRALYRHLTDIHRDFVFGVQDNREDEAGWGGDVRLLLNRNVAVHLVSHFTEGMSAKSELPQFTVFPDAARADQVEKTRMVLEEDDVVIEGAIFYVDPDDYDVYLREALEVHERYGDWEAVPDTYYLHTELVHFLNRVVLEEPLVARERELDFRLPFVGGTEPPALDETNYTAEELITPEGEEPRDEDDEGPTRSIDVEWGHR